MSQETELGIVISDGDWMNIWKMQQSTTSSHVWREHCWKNVIQFFINPKITSKYMSRVQPCWRKCRDVNVNHLHVFWLCPKIAPFWDDVHTVIVKILGYSIPKTRWIPVENIVGGLQEGITKKWSWPNIPTREEWLQIVGIIFEMESLTYKLRTQEERCQDKWEKWAVFTSAAKNGQH
uniref:Reverse transcriptase zinc-binding domain-containing protein n=1 Tax=Monopterus albus TaxID=43700 RepID=A0A3Q3KCI8_MONAL